MTRDEEDDEHADKDKGQEGQGQRSGRLNLNLNGTLQHVEVQARDVAQGVIYWRAADHEPGDQGKGEKQAEDNPEEERDQVNNSLLPNENPRHLGRLCSQCPQDRETKLPLVNAIPGNQYVSA